MNILEFNGICHETKFGVVAIYESIEIIEAATNFKGVPLEPIPGNSITGAEKFIISFSLLFPSGRARKKFEEFLNKYYFL